MDNKTMLGPWGPWILTDDDCFQICRRYDEDHYELYQITGQEEIGFYVTHAIIDYNECHIKSICDCYGYEGIEQLQSMYGDAWKQIIAECQFELDSADPDNTICGAACYEEAERLIRLMSGYDEDEKTERLRTILDSAISKLVEDGYKDTILDRLGTDEEELQGLGITWDGA